jgi:hypothetical protein
MRSTEWLHTPSSLLDRLAPARVAPRAIVVDLGRSTKQNMKTATAIALLMTRCLAFA